ncbi:diguanylate cyclase [uncultured Clostridium sp.]|uniref:diguanylate cyclase n=1 Tax=uncultured Clostridium sp. TaxID=59620 RepID=UPI0025FA5BEE|nr:diguanylate cyclase [uncultured Clostridium sp.]
MKVNVINSKVDENLLNIRNLIDNDLFYEAQDDSASEYDDFREMSRYNNNYYINSLQRKNKFSEAYLLKAYEDLQNKNYKNAEDNLRKSFDNMKKSTSVLSKIYAGTFLSKIYESKNESFTAIEVVRYSLSNISKKYYNNYYKEIWMLMETIVDTEAGSAEVISWSEEILESYKDLSNDAKLYLTIRLENLYVMNDNYAKASEHIIRACYIAYDIKDNYSLSRCITDLSVIFKKIENKDRAIELLNYALSQNIDNEEYKVYRDTYAYINLAEIYAELRRYKEAEMVLNKIPLYKEYFTEAKAAQIEIKELLIRSEVSCYENDLIKSKEFLDSAGKIISKYSDILNKEAFFNYFISYGNYLEYRRKYNEAVKLYDKVLKLSIENDNIYYQRKLMKKLMNIAIKSRGYNLDEQYIMELADIINNNEDMVYKDYSHYILETVKSEMVIERQKDIYRIIFKVLFLSIISTVVVFLIFYRKTRKLRIQNMKDGLTKVYNRVYFNELYEKFIKKGIDFAIIMIDIDNFKNLNDTYGHQFGDNVLIKICSEISKLSHDDMKLCRYGGEEFVVAVPNKTKDEVIEYSQNIRKIVEQITWEENVKVTLSIGVALSSDFKEDTLKYADQNLYVAKTTGKNKVVWK